MNSLYLKGALHYESSQLLNEQWICMSLQQPVELSGYDHHFTHEQTEGQREVTCLGLCSRSGFEHVFWLQPFTVLFFFPISLTFLFQKTLFLKFCWNWALLLELSKVYFYFYMYLHIHSYIYTHTYTLPLCVCIYIYKDPNSKCTSYNCTESKLLFALTLLVS